MGKTVENKIKTMKIQKADSKESKESKSLPIPLPDEKTIYQCYRGKNIVILNGQIIAIASSLEEAYDKIEGLIPKGKRCRIRYIEEGIAIYGFDF